MTHPMLYSKAGVNKHTALQHAPLHCSTPKIHTARCCAAAQAAQQSLVSLAPLNSAHTATVMERRAADVAVLGAGATALLAAYTLAKSGRKVLLLPSYGLSAAVPPPSPRHPLKLTDTDPLLVHLASESAAYWRGLQVLAGMPLLEQQQTLDVVINPEADHAGALGFAKLQEACAAAGVTAAPLISSEVVSSFRQMQLPASSAGLMQPDGGVLHAADIQAAATRLAERAGVMMRPDVVLQGWRDRGSCFQLRTSSRLSPDLVCLYECEVLLLVPSHWQAASLGLFGLQLEGMQVHEVLQCQLPATAVPQQLPVCQHWGSGTDQPDTQAGIGVMPPSPGKSSSHGGLTLQQLPSWGHQVQELPARWRPARHRWLRGNELKEADKEEQEPGQQLTWADLQIEQLRKTCCQLVRGVGPLSQAKFSSTLRSCVQDGRPIVGQHPGFDPGRLIVCCSSSGSTPFGPGTSSSSYQLSPKLAKMAAIVVTSAGAAGSSDSSVLQGVGLDRDGVGAAVADGFAAFDSWEGLQQFQAAAAHNHRQEEDEQGELTRLQ